MAADSGIKSGEVVPRRSEAEWADVIRADLARSVQGIIDAGQHLAQAKEQVGHGGWSEWLKDRLAMNPQAAQRLMAVARNPVLSNASHATFLPASSYALYVLSRASDGQLTKAIEAGVITPDMERRDAEKWIEAERVRGLGLTGKPGRSGKPPETSSAVKTEPPEISSETETPASSVASTVPGTAQPVEPGVINASAKTPVVPAVKSDPAPCPGCAHLQQLLDDRSAELEAAHRRIGALEDANKALTARIQNGSGGSVRADSGTGIMMPVQAADGAHGQPQAPSEPPPARLCGRVPAARVSVEANGTPRPDVEWLCAEHREKLAGRPGVIIAAVPAGEWDVGSCQVRVREKVSA
jgi:Protein of unknown function (DUF3102)